LQLEGESIAFVLQPWCTCWQSRCCGVV